MEPKPVLNTIRELLKFKDSTTISEISKYTKIPQEKVLGILNKNGEMVWRNRKNGRITKVDPRSVLRAQLRESDKYYWRDSYGAWSVEGYELVFNGHPEIKEELKTKCLVGALGDCWKEDHVLDTPENREFLESSGLKLWSETEVDDRLWEE